MSRLLLVTSSVFLLVGVSPEAAYAYVGPGAGITAIGTLIALVGAVLLAIVGFLWYPIKRLRAKRPQAKSEGAESTDDAPPTS